MATIYRRKLPSGSVKWYITHGRGQERRRFAAGDTKGQAEAALRLFERQLAQHGEPPEGLTCAEAARRYQEHLDLNRSPATARRYGRVLKTFFEAFLHQVHPAAALLRDVKAAHLEDFKRRRLAGEISESRSQGEFDRADRLHAEARRVPCTEGPRANAKYGVLGGKRLQAKVTKRTINYELQCLKTFFRWAIRHNNLFANPAESIERFRISKRALPKFLTHPRRPWAGE